MSDEHELNYGKSSWHYKVVFLVFCNYHWFNPVPTNLCPYLRKLVISIPAYPFVLIWNKLPEKINEHTDIGRILFIYFIIVHTVWTLIYFLSGGIYYERTWEDGSITNEVAKQLDWYWGTVFYLGSIAVCAVGGGIIVVVCDYLDERKNRQRRDGTYKKSNQTIKLVKDYMNSKHSKICPHINFIDDEEKKK